MITTLGIDIGKNWFHVVALDASGKPVRREKMDREKLVRFASTCNTTLIGMEACAGSQWLARRLLRAGRQVRLIAPRFIKAYLKSNKNDFNDAAAIAEAVQRLTMRFVPIRSLDQVDMQAVHRVRDQLVAERTATINQMRAFLLEYGIAVPAGRGRLPESLPAILEDGENELTPVMRSLLHQLKIWLARLADELEETEQRINVAASHDPRCLKLRQIPGVGPIVATALVAAAGNGAQFRRARDMAAWIELVPRQYSTGGRPRLLGISKRGNGYLRRLLVQGARAVINRTDRKRHRFGSWLTQFEQRAHQNIVAVGLANKLARIAWAVLRGDEPYRTVPA